MSKSFNKLAQQLLVNQGFDLSIDGRDSDAFRAAIKDFQIREGLKPTATVTEETLNALRAFDVPLPRPRPAFVAKAATLPHSVGREQFVAGDPGGLVEEGNDPLRFGVDARTLEEPDGHVVLASLTPSGDKLSDAEVIEQYRLTGAHMGKFGDQASATAYARRLQNPPREIWPNQFQDMFTGSLSRKEFDERFTGEVKTLDQSSGVGMDNKRHPPKLKPRPKTQPKGFKTPKELEALRLMIEGIGKIGNRAMGPQK